jgi:hypothetical protein
VLFSLWLAQFLVPAWRMPITYVYAAWGVGLIVAWPWQKPTAPQVFWRLLHSKR